MKFYTGLEDERRSIDEQIVEVKKNETAKKIGEESRFSKSISFSERIPNSSLSKKRK